MKSILRWTAAMTILVAVAATAGTAAAASQIKWYDYDEAVALSRQEGKKLFLHFYTDWCPYCEKMQTETFTDAALIAYLDTHFIAARVNSDNDRKVAATYGVRGVPVTWFVAEDGRKISSRPGFVDPRQLTIILKYIQTDSYKTMSFKTFMDAN